jgi:hypothetical protein
LAAKATNNADKIEMTKGNKMTTKKQAFIWSAPMK